MKVSIPYSRRTSRVCVPLPHSVFAKRIYKALIKTRDIWWWSKSSHSAYILRAIQFLQRVRPCYPKTRNLTYRLQNDSVRSVLQLPRSNSSWNNALTRTHSNSSLAWLRLRLSVYAIFFSFCLPVFSKTNQQRAREASVSIAPRMNILKLLIIYPNKYKVRIHISIIV